MKRAQIASLAALALAAAAMGYLAWRNRQPPVLPADDMHAAFDSHVACLECHGPQGPAPQSRNHPLGNDCMRCHGPGR